MSKTQSNFNQELKQAAKMVESAKTLLITGPAYPSGDLLATSLGLFSAVQNIAGLKKALVAFPGSLPQKFSFLAGFDQIAGSAESLGRTVISISPGKPVSRLLYNQEKEGLKIYLSPSQSPIKKQDITIETEKPRPDLVIALGAQSQSQLKLLNELPGSIKNRRLININLTTPQPAFGQINLNQAGASALAEIGLGLIKALGQNLSSACATCLLAGLIDATENFRASNTTPEAFLHAAELLKAGANQQLIIQKLYAAKELTEVKLWARALKGLSHDEQAQVIWAELKPADFKAAGAAPKHLSGALDELRSHNPTAKAGFLIWQYQKNEKPQGLIAFSPSAFKLKSQFLAKLKAKDLGAKVLFTLPKSAAKTDPAQNPSNLVRPVLELIKSAN